MPPSQLSTTQTKIMNEINETVQHIEHTETKLLSLVSSPHTYFNDEKQPKEDQFISHQYSLLTATNTLIGRSSRQKLSPFVYNNKINTLHRIPAPSERTLNSVYSYLLHRHRHRKQQNQQHNARVVLNRVQVQQETSKKKKKRRKKISTNHNKYYNDSSELDKLILLSTRSSNDACISNARNVERELRAIRARGGSIKASLRNKHTQATIPACSHYNFAVPGGVKIDQPNVYYINNHFNFINPWTCHEKLILMRALKKYGKNFKAVADQLNYKDLKSVIAFYYRFKRLLGLNQIVRSSPNNITQNQTHQQNSVTNWYQSCNASKNVQANCNSSTSSSDTYKQCHIDDQELIRRAYLPLPSYSLMFHDDEDDEDDQSDNVNMEYEEPRNHEQQQQHQADDDDDETTTEKEMKIEDQDDIPLHVDMHMNQPLQGDSEADAGVKIHTTKTENKLTWEKQPDPWCSSNRQMMVVVNPLIKEPRSTSPCAPRDVCCQLEEEGARRMIDQRY